jgi:transposase
LSGRKRGAHTGPNPTDRGKKGCKRHVLTDRGGVPLVVHTGPANQNDEKRLEGLLRWLPVIPTKAGTPRRVLAVLADAAYGVAWLIALIAGLGYRPWLKPRGKAGRRHGSGLGTKRYVVERTMAWLDNDRRLRVCYERTWGSWQGFHELSACVFCAKRLQAVREPLQS